MPTAAVNGTELHYERQGTGEPLLLIMGMGGSHRHWGEPFLELVARDFEAVCYDHRGIGYSAPLEGDLSIKRLADDALALLDALAIERAHVFGVSMGGMVAQELALAAPARLRSLTLGCTWPGGAHGHFTSTAVATRIREAALSGDRSRAIRVGWEINLSKEYRSHEARYAAFSDLAESMRAPIPVLIAQGYACATHDAYERLAQITAPTLVVHGDEDSVLNVANAPLIAEQIPGARLELLERTGHMFWWERPQRSAELVREHATPATAATAG